MRLAGGVRFPGTQPAVIPLANGNLPREQGQLPSTVQGVEEVQLEEELEPHFEGDVSLVDSETGATLDVTMDPAAIEAYVLRLTGLVEELRAWARRHGASYVRLANDEALEGPVRRFVARAVD